MKTVSLTVLLFLTLHLVSAQITWTRTWTTGPNGGGGGDFGQLFRELLNNIPNAPSFKQIIYGGPHPSRRPSIPRPGYTPIVPSNGPPVPPEGPNDQYNPRPAKPQPPSDIKPLSATCTKEYQKLRGHTLCMTDKPNVSKQGITEATKQAILDQHNRLRATVQPPAMDLVELKWDERLAAVAQKWANQCEAGHDRQRSIPSIGMSIGQNVAGGYRTWEQAVQMWWDEIDMWTYGVEPDSYLGPGGWKKIGHFTQMAQNGTYLVGCGFAVCDRTTFTRYYVCDYAAGQSNLASPYTTGRRCSKCPNFCRNGQCDCGGKVCYNGGTLNIETCQCECQKLYKGPTCEQLDCPAEDKWVCGRDWTPSYCGKFVNVPFDCPYMCGKCGNTNDAIDAMAAESEKPKPPFVSAFGCKYGGKRSSRQECQAYGDRGLDIMQCGSKNGTLTCADCNRFSNVKREMCPIMCGLCDHPCNGKECQNGGTLDVNTCTCRCERPYIGDMCEKVDCSNPDESHCEAWPKYYCEKYDNVPRDCPVRCGLCPGP
ncbi:uncharacterized protein LOC134236903 [Saccostrea cucullata]|uniref:uncharacterized protein LOC134236903 n=1 Tax=Saccostrea cuccullata TaxID=36930 RepID=UPI002ED3BED3